MKAKMESYKNCFHINTKTSKSVETFLKNDNICIFLYKNYCPFCTKKYRAFSAMCRAKQYDGVKFAACNMNNISTKNARLIKEFVKESFYVYPKMVVVKNKSQVMISNSDGKLIEKTKKMFI